MNGGNLMYLKKILGGMLSGSLFLVAFGLQARTLNLSNAEDQVAADRKIQCSTKDEKPVYYTWSGAAWSRTQGTPDRKLFRVEGMNVRQCISVEDRVRGTGWRIVSREIMLYLDPETEEVLETWDNPWTGETVDVIHVTNDPVNSRSANFAISEDGKVRTSPIRIEGDKFFLDFVIPLFYTNPLAGDYQKYVGNYYHAVEIFNFSGDVKELLDDRTDSVSPTIAWVRVAPWLPWMGMGGREGLMYFSATGQKLSGWRQMPDVLKREINRNYREYRNPPPADDKRRNQTSWTFFKQVIESRK